jgi:hypothetical protein
MALWSGPIAGVSPIVAGVFALLGSVIGGAIAATATFLVGRRASEVAATSWLRDARREVYARFLSDGQQLLIEHEGSFHNTRAIVASEAIDQAHSAFFEVYPGVQLVGTRPVVEAARVYAYRLLELREGRLGVQNFGRVSELVRLARHDVIDAMREEYGLPDSARPAEGRFNAFLGTELADRYQETIGRSTSATP